MNHSGAHLARPRPTVLPPLSTRTLHHPSFLPLYMAAGFEHHHKHCNNQTVHPIIPAEVYYTDPTMRCGRRIPNLVSDSEIFDCFQLNTPPPVMSTCLAPPNCPDPFRSGPLPTRELGCPKWKMIPIHSPLQPSQAILQLTEEEDQAITNLLKLHHQEPGQIETPADVQMNFPSAPEPPVNFKPCLFLSPPEPMDSSSAEEVYRPVCSDVQYPRKAGLGNHLKQGRSWSNMELEAADTLLSGFGLMDEDKIWDQCHQKPAVTLPDPRPCHHNTDLPVRTETHKKAVPTLKAALCTQNDISYIRFACAGENREPVWGDFRSCEDRGASGDFSDVRERMLSDLEGDAVHVLLSLGDMRPLVGLQ